MDKSLELYSDIFFKFKKTHLTLYACKFSVDQSSKGVEVKSQKILIAWLLCFYDMNAYFGCFTCHHFTHMAPG